MSKLETLVSAPHRVMVGVVILGLVALTGCQTPEQQRYADLDTCSSMGANYGSSSHTACMLQQQQRHDDAQLRTLQEARLAQKLADDAREAQERIKYNKNRD
jgi:hypothetical protein